MRRHRYDLYRLERTIVKTITPPDMNTLLATEPDLAMIDVRTPVEFSEVHATRAKNLPLDTLRPKALFESGELRKDRPVYLICRTGGRAVKAAEKFAAQGFDQGVVVEGGTEAWSAAGLPVERSAAKTISLERQVRIAAGSLVLIGVLLACFVNPGFLVLSGFVGAGLVFAGITDWCGMGLLLAKFPWNRRS
jgi:rhodanese-related sulfurtransferase